MSLTDAQQDAVTARGNVLVVAGAGAGKTSTLVARCLHCLLEEQPPVGLDQLLLVTFTEAAAADMRKKIRAALERQILEKRRPPTPSLSPSEGERVAEGRVRGNVPASPIGPSLSETDLRDRQSEAWLAEQLGLFETAHIGTLHSFCFQLVRQHFYELGLDPQLAVMPGEEELLLASEILDKILQDHYAAETPESVAVQQLIQTQARGWDVPIRALVFKLHHYSQTLRDPAGWFARQLAMFESPEPLQWRAWLVEGSCAWRDRWLASLRAQPDNVKAPECAAALAILPDQPTREQCAAALDQALLADGNWPKGKKTALRKPLEHFFAEAQFLRSLARTAPSGDPLTEDWNWVRPQMTALLRLAQEFTAKFGEEKRELAVVDFHDLEQHALRLLIEPATGRPTAIARQWQEKLRFVFVDEYQDINDAQDAILKALSREGAAANRFLVGDVKQSIYRFRLADPHIFQNYVASWGVGEGRIIPLADNFRSREAILEFVNSLFSGLMRREIGGVPYDADAHLRFGDPKNRYPLSRAHDATPRAELILRLKAGADEAVADDDGGASSAEFANLEEADKEARLVALRLRELKNEGHLIWDEHPKAMRPVEWSDMAILLRSPSGKAESYAKEFTRLGVPLLVARGGFYESIEVTDLLSLLQLLDNPLQDLPLLAVLRSPLAGLSPDELATIRLQLPKGSFWAALQHFHEAGAARAGEARAGWDKADRFLKSFGAWRRLARQVSLSRCLESVLGETHYEAWLLAQSRGEQRQANVQRLLALARQFDRFQRQGLFRFLRFIEAQQAAETEPEVGAVAVENSVSLMSIHQSKGLEFPVVVVADLGKQFNLADLRAELMLDEQYGLCPQIKPPHTGRRYPSLPYWLARQRQKQELLGEEMRLLYVAMTRARDTLILTGSVSQRDFDNRWQEPAARDIPSLLAARNYLDWLAGWWVNAPDTAANRVAGANDFLRWTIREDDSQLLAEATPATSESAATPTPAKWQELRQRLEWQYPHAAATREPAKTSVSVLRRRLADETDAEAKPRFDFKTKFAKAKIKTDESEMSATEVGTAHHVFLQFVALDRTGSRAELEREAKRLEDQQVLEPAESASLDLDALADFWGSDLGQKIRAQRDHVRRELAFTARFAPGELPGTMMAAGEVIPLPTDKQQRTGRAGSPLPADGAHGVTRPTSAGICQSSMATGLTDDDFVVVQGVADLVVLLPQEIWLVDFKTDDVAPSELDEKVKLYEPQLQLYARALGRIYRRKVSAMHLHFLAARRSVSLPPPD